jgi:hypothetical protein
MRVSHHHLVRRPAPKLHQFLKAGATLHMPGRPGVPKVMPAEVVDPGAVTGQAKSSVLALTTMFPEGAGLSRRNFNLISDRLKPRRNVSA